MVENKKFSAIIVTYNPDVQILIANISRIKPQVDKVLIVDNGSGNIAFIKKAIQDVEIFELEINVGIAKALNIGIGYVQNLGYDWVFTLDQDSILPENVVQEFLKFINNNNMKSVGILAPRIIDRGWDKKQIEIEKKFITGDYQIIKRAITSGNLVNISAWEKVGGFDDELFIDWVDFDFNKRLELQGFSIIQINSVTMNHEIGVGIHPKLLHRILLYSKNRKFYDHSSIRQYYFYRNKVIYFRRYEKGWKKARILFLVALSAREAFLYSSPKFRKFGSAIKGLKDGFQFKIR